MGLGRKKAENGRDTIELQVSGANSISKCNVVALGSFFLGKRVEKQITFVR